MCYIEPRLINNLHTSKSPNPTRPIVRKSFKGNPLCDTLLPEAEPIDNKKNRTLKDEITPTVPMKIAGMRYSGLQ